MERANESVAGRASARQGTSVAVAAVFAVLSVLLPAASVVAQPTTTTTTPPASQYAATNLRSAFVVTSAGPAHNPGKSGIDPRLGYRITWTAPTTVPESQSIQVSFDRNFWQDTCTVYNHTQRCTVPIENDATQFEYVPRKAMYVRVFTDYSGTTNDSGSQPLLLPAYDKCDNIATITTALNIDNPSSNTAPVFDSGTSVNVTIPEDPRRGQAIASSAVLGVTDDDSTSHTWSVLGECGFGDLFSITPSSGQLTFDSDQYLTFGSPIFDFEDGITRSLIVTVDDGSGGGDAILVRLPESDVNEPPNAEPVRISASVEAPSSVTVEYLNPGQKKGVPFVTGLDVRYRAGTTRVVTDRRPFRPPQIVESSTAAWTVNGSAVSQVAAEARKISGLSANTSYHIQLRFRNAEGAGPWSPSLTAITSSAASTSTVYAATSLELGSQERRTNSAPLHQRAQTEQSTTSRPSTPATINADDTYLAYEITWTAPTTALVSQAIQVSDDGTDWSSRACTWETRRLACQLTIGAYDTAFNYGPASPMHFRVFTDHTDTANDSYSQSVRVPGLGGV